MSTTTTAVVAAVDVGGTRIKAALVDASLNVVAGSTEPTPSGLAGDLGAVVHGTIARLVAASGEIGRDVRVVGCGLVVPGLVDESTGTGVLSVNLGWRDLRIRDAVAAALTMPTAVGHDVRAGLVAEKRLGAAREAGNALFVPVGTGIAGALLLDGRVVLAEGWAGEIGHLVVEPDGPACSCGGRGCLETVASAAAIAREYTAQSAGGRTAADAVVTAETVARRALEGEPLALAVWARAVDALARALVATATITGVELVVVGGGLAQSGEVLLGPLRRRVDELMTIQRRPRIVAAVLGDRAGCLGAAILAWDAMRERDTA